MFYRCFFFVLFFIFFRPPKIWDNRSWERLNGFSWNFHQTIPGKMEFATLCRRLANVVPPPGEWRMLMSVRHKYETTVLGNGWKDFHETFTKQYREKKSLQRRAAAWRMSCRRLANVDNLHNLRYDSGAITRGRHTQRLRYKIMSGRMDLI